MKLTVTIKEPTRISLTTATCIDYICTDLEPDQYLSSLVVSGWSDHYGLVLKINNNSEYVNKPHKRRFFSMKNTINFKHSLAAETWEAVYNIPPTYVNKQYEMFHNILKYYLDISFPSVTSLSKNFNKKI